jgi:hypothetical protein
MRTASPIGGTWKSAGKARCISSGGGSGAATPSDGVGLVTGSLLSVSYYGGIEGIVVYAISEDGSRLTGRWAVRNGDGRVFEEMLVRR